MKTKKLGDYKTNLLHKLFQKVKSRNPKKTGVLKYRAKKKFGRTREKKQHQGLGLKDAKCMLCGL